MASLCPFCPPAITAPILWESEYYRIIPDEYPRCTGHLLLISKFHQPSHMHIPIERLPAFEFAQNQARRFLMDTFGKVSFLENGGIRQEVLHAHLHCVPFTSTIPKVWEDQGIVRSIQSWKEVWLECEQVGHYCYLETLTGCYVLCQDSAYMDLLDEMRLQITKQTNAKICSNTGSLERGGIKMVDNTVQLWEEWSQKE